MHRASCIRLRWKCLSVCLSRMLAPRLWCIQNSKWNFCRHQLQVLHAHTRQINRIHVRTSTAAERTQCGIWITVAVRIRVSSSTQIPPPRASVRVAVNAGQCQCQFRTGNLGRFGVSASAERANQDGAGRCGAVFQAKLQTRPSRAESQPEVSASSSFVRRR